MLDPNNNGDNDDDDDDGESDVVDDNLLFLAVNIGDNNMDI